MEMMAAERGPKRKPPMQTTVSFTSIWRKPEIWGSSLLSSMAT